MFTLKVEVGRWHHVLQIQVGGAGQSQGWGQIWRLRGQR